MCRAWSVVSTVGGRIVRSSSYPDTIRTRAMAPTPQPSLAPSWRIRSAVRFPIVRIFAVFAQQNKLSPYDPRRDCVVTHEPPILVISSGARDLAFSVPCEEKISRLQLEMTATKVSTGRRNPGLLTFVRNDRLRPTLAMESRSCSGNRRGRNLLTGSGGSYIGN